MNEFVDVFNIHKDIIDDYKNFVESFIFIDDERTKKKVEKGIREGKFWPEPLIVFNPSFEMKGPIKDLCDDGLLHPTAADIFYDFKLYRHQVEAITKAGEGMDFVAGKGARRENTSTIRPNPSVVIIVIRSIIIMAV